MLWTIGLGVMKLAMVYLLGAVVDTMGRRPPLLISGAGVLLSNFGEFGFQRRPLYSSNTSTPFRLTCTNLANPPRAGAFGNQS